LLGVHPSPSAGRFCGIRLVVLPVEISFSGKRPLGKGYAMVIIDHLASIVTLIGFPLILFGLVDLYRERKLTIWQARKWVGITFLLLGCAAWGADIADRFGYIRLTSLGISSNTGPIVWNFEETAAGHGYFLNLQKPTNGEIKVVGFGAHGKNNSSEPLKDFDAHLRSDITNETMPIYMLAAESNAINLCTLTVPTLAKDTLGIPAFADFDIVSYGKLYFINALVEDAMPLSKFLNQFVPFTVVMTYNGKNYHRQFSKVEVERQVALLEKLSAPITTPHVVRKQSAPTTTLPPFTTPRPPSSAPSISPGITEKIPEK
jgi:hypothetical protein